MALATAVRIRGGLNDLWLDEVWSLKLVSGITSAWQVFTNIHHDNNHYLNGLWLYWLGPHRDPIWYRLPSMAEGAGAVIVAGLIGRRRSPAAGIFALLLTGFSYVLVLYSSEARGYSGAVFFSFLAYYAMDSYLERPRWTMAALYSAAALLGLASHLVFINVLLASIVWSWWRLKSVRPVLACQAAPVFFLVWLYAVDVRRMVEGGSGQPHPGLVGTFASALGWAFGSSSIMGCLVSIAVLAAALRLLRDDEKDSLVFLTGVILFFPILLADLRHSPTIYPRYFVLSIAFLLVLGADVLGWMWQRGAAGKGACVVLLAAYFAANGRHIAELFRYGRGGYRDAIHFIAGHSHGPAITIDSDNDFQVPLVLDYDKDALEGKPMKYHPRTIGPWEPEWLISQKESLDEPSPPHGLTPESDGVQYELVATYPTAPLSGLRWYLYHKRP